jgi:CheY-like chemotaxis protein/GAF domain-containing protein
MERPILILPSGTRLDPAVRDRLERDVRIVEGEPSEVLTSLGEGIGVVESSGVLSWRNRELDEHGPEVVRKFTETCLDALRIARAGLGPIASGGSERCGFQVGSRFYEAVVSATSTPPSRVAGLLLDVTRGRQLQSRLDAVDAAGGELLRIDGETVANLNAAERLRALETRVVAAVRSIFGWDHFEFRLLNRESGQLELVICNGLSPMGIGEKLFAKAEGQGLSGLVAVSGTSIVCRDVAREPRYLPALPGARSSLTVPLKLHDKTIGTLNVESEQAAAFGEEDRLCAEIFARYVAMAFNILDMLVVERYTTNRKAGSNLLAEITIPLDEIRHEAKALAERLTPDPKDAGERILEALASVRSRIEAATSGPQNVLGVEEILREGERDPLLAAKRVLVVDDEASVRETVRSVLEQKGCFVRSFSSGTAAIDAIRDAIDNGKPWDLVISDVRMPDRTGYEVFRAAREASSTLPVILMTGFGYDPHHSIVRSSQEGLHCFLFKPFQASQLLEEARKALLEGKAAG